MNTAPHVVMGAKTVPTSSPMGTPTALTPVFPLVEVKKEPEEAASAIGSTGTCQMKPTGQTMMQGVYQSHVVMQQMQQVHPSQVQPSIKDEAGLDVPMDHVSAVEKAGMDAIGKFLHKSCQGPFSKPLKDEEIP